MVVVQAVEHLAAILAGPHQAHLAQAAHVVRNGGFADAGGGGQGADVEFALARAAMMRTRLGSLKARKSSATAAAVRSSRAAGWWMGAI